MKNLISCAFPLAVGIFGIFHSSLALAEVTSNVIIPLVETIDIPCANDGAGETVDLTGNLHLLVITNISNTGNVTVKTQYNPQGVIGVGRTTGDIYRGTGVTETFKTFGGTYPIVFTDINNFRIIGKGAGANYSIHYDIHMTINANGTATAYVDNFSENCK